MKKASVSATNRETGTERTLKGITNEGSPTE
jgi:hypothetical protein